MFSVGVLLSILSERKKNKMPFKHFFFLVEKVLLVIYNIFYFYNISFTIPFIFHNAFDITVFLIQNKNVSQKGWGLIL